MKLFISWRNVKSRRDPMKILMLHPILRVSRNDESDDKEQIYVDLMKTAIKMLHSR